MEGNRLYYGDNLQMLRDYVASESVDLIYLDPPFNSNRAYNVIYHEMSGEGSHAQITAFDDTWTWSPETDQVYLEILGGGSNTVANAIEAMVRLLEKSDLMAYLVMMTVRLQELYRVLKPTGSLYIHCDPTASHYLKIMLDAIFGPRNFRNEIIWRRTGAHGPLRSFGPIHDTLLFYSRTSEYYFDVVLRPYMKGHVDKRYKVDETGRSKFTSGGNVLTGSGATGGESGRLWRGFDPSAKNRHWAVPGFLTEQMPESFQSLGVLAKLDALYDAGLIDITPGTAWPTPVRYLDETKSGQPLQDIWAYQPYTEGTVHGTTEGIDADVAWFGTTDPERLGFPTQKPLGLLERIIRSSCPTDGMVLDPFCGCGTAVIAAEKLGRSWIGIDITYIAIDLIQKRLVNAFPERTVEYETVGIPRDLTGARALFSKSAFDFERWAVSMAWGTPNQKQVGDKGIDGVIRFPMGSKASDGVGRVLISVKGGGTVPPGDARDLLGTVDGQGAEMGLLIVFEKPKKGLLEVAATSGNYIWPVNHAPYPKLQIMTVAELLDGKRPYTPTPLLPYIKAKGQVEASLELPFTYEAAEKSEGLASAAEGGLDDPLGDSLPSSPGDEAGSPGPPPAS